MDKKTVLDLINALQKLKNLNFQQNRSVKKYLVLISNLAIEWFQSHQQILMKISKDMNELMKHISNKPYFEEYIQKSDKELKQALQKYMGNNIKVLGILKEFQLNENGLGQKELEFEYLLNEIKDSLR